MSKLVEYFDRLPSEKIDKLRTIAGGELFWKRTFPHLPKSKKAKFGEVVFGRKVKNVNLMFETNLAGWDIPIIIAEEA